MAVEDGAHCPGCGLPNYQGLCPHCRGDQDEYERELVPPFPPSRESRDCPECDAPMVEETPGDFMCWCCEWMGEETQ